jgi:acetyl-CoA decarbonylase/synthase complex subunit beta
LCFYIPDLDGLGIVHRGFKETLPLGLDFSSVAGQVSGGVQFDGYCGTSLRTARQDKFMQGDGGWERVVWMPKELKERLADAIPEEIYAKIADEEVGTDDTDAIKKWLVEMGHPIKARYEGA